MINLRRLLLAAGTHPGAGQGLPDQRPAADRLRFDRSRGPVVIWNITGRCNLNCLYCHPSARKEPEGEELSCDEAMRLVESIGKLGAPMLSLYGGEPLLREDLTRVARAAAGLGLKVILSTNGTLLDRRWARKIRESGISYVGFNLDGLAQVTGEGPMDIAGGIVKMQRAVGCLQEEGIPCGIRVTVTPENLEDLEGVFSAAVAGGIKRLAFFQVRAQGTSGTDWPASRRLRRRMMAGLLCLLRAWDERGYPIEVVTEDVYADGVFLHHEIQRENPAGAARVRRLLEMQGGCPAGMRLLQVDAWGNIFPCPSWRYKLGNVRERSLEEIRQGEHPLLELLWSRDGCLGGRCSRCGYKELCGGCRARAGAAREGIFGPDPLCYLADEELAVPLPTSSSAEPADVPIPNRCT